jgi:predicted nucleic acid-binding protein
VNPRSRSFSTDAAIIAIARGRSARRIATFNADFESVEGIEVVPGATMSY